MPDGYIGSYGKADPNWWLEQITKGIEYRQKSTFEKDWARWRRYTRGEWAPGVMPVNLFFTMVHTIVPRIYFRNPSVSIVSTKPGPLFMAFARLLERVDSKLIKEMHLKERMKKVIYDAFLFGTGVGVGGYGAVYEYQHQGHVEQPRIGKDSISVEYDQHTTPNMPWFGRTHPGTFVVPAGADDFFSTRWNVQFIERAVEDVKVDPRLDTEARKNIGSGYLLPDQYGSMTRNEFSMRGRRDDVVQMAVIRDRKTRRVVVIGPTESNKGMILFDGDDGLQDRGFPNYPLIFNHDPECFWGVPDSQILEPYQREINEIRTQQMKHRRLTLIKLLAQKGKIDQTEISKMLSEEVGSVVWTQDSPQRSIQPLQAADIPQSLMVAEEQTFKNVRDTVGFSRNQFGEYNSATAETTATEAQIVEQATEIRIDERRDSVADLFETIIEGMHDSIFRNWSHREVLDVIGPGGVPVWVAFTPQMLRHGQYHVRIDADSGMPTSRQARERKAIQVYQLMAQNPHIDTLKLTQYLLHEMHGTAFDDMLKAMPPVDPGQGVVNPIQYSQMIQQSVGRAQQGGPEQIPNRLLAQNANVRS